MHNDDFSDEVTLGEKYDPPMHITDQAEADAYFEKLIRHRLKHGYSRAQAEQLERSNLGYYAAYFGHETRERVERLFSCQHPVFGSA